MFDATKFIADIEALTGAAIEKKDLKCGCDLAMRIEPAMLQECAKLLLRHEFFLSFLTAVHLSPACDVIYQFGQFETSCRLQLKISAGTEKAVPSIADIYQGASWHEREINDFFGIAFTGNHDLKPLILSREESDFKPLLKSAEQLKTAADISPAPAPAPAAN